MVLRTFFNNILLSSS